MSEEFPGSVPDADKLYLARDCGGLKNCKELSESIVPAGETIKLMQRNYIRPGTARGPAAEEVLSPSVIILNGATRP